MSAPRYFALMAGHGAIFLWVVNATYGEGRAFAANALPLAGQAAAVALIGMALAYFCTATNKPLLRLASELCSGLLFVGMLSLWIASVGFGVAFNTPFGP